MSAPLELDLKAYWPRMDATDRRQISLLISMRTVIVHARVLMLAGLNRRHPDWHISERQIYVLHHDPDMVPLIEAQGIQIVNVSLRPRSEHSTQVLSDAPFIDDAPTVCMPSCSVCQRALRDELVFHCRHCGTVYCSAHAGVDMIGRTFALQQQWLYGCSVCQRQQGGAS